MKYNKNIHKVTRSIHKSSRNSQATRIRIAIRKRRLAKANQEKLKSMQEKHDWDDQEDRGPIFEEMIQEEHDQEPAASQDPSKQVPEESPSFEEFPMPPPRPPKPKPKPKPNSTEDVPKRQRIDVEFNPIVLATMTERERHIHTAMVLRQRVVPLRSRARRKEERRKLKEIRPVPEMPGPYDRISTVLSTTVARDERYLKAYNKAVDEFRRAILVNDSDDSEEGSSEETSEEDIPEEEQTPVFDAPEFEEVIRGVEPFDLEKCKLTTPVEEIPGYDIEKGGSALDMYIKGYGSEIQKEFDRIVLHPPTIRFPKMVYDGRTDRKGKAMLDQLFKPRDSYSIAKRCYSITYMFQAMEYLTKEEVKAVVDEINANQEEEEGPCDISKYYWPPEVPGIPYTKCMVYHWLFLRNVRYMIRDGEIHFIGNSASIKIPGWLRPFSENFPTLTFHDERRTYRTIVRLSPGMKDIRLEWIASYLAEIQVKWDFSKEYICVRRCKKKQGKDGFKVPLGRACYSPKCLVWTYNLKRKIAPLLTEEDEEPVVM